MDLLQSLQDLQTPTLIVGQFCYSFSRNITFKNPIFFQKWTLVKLLESCLPTNLKKREGKLTFSSRYILFRQGIPKTGFDHKYQYKLKEL